MPSILKFNLLLHVRYHLMVYYERNKGFVSFKSFCSYINKYITGRLYDNIPLPNYINSVLFGSCDYMVDLFGLPEAEVFELILEFFDTRIYEKDVELMNEIKKLLEL